jgi:hypothetical protein
MIWPSKSRKVWFWCIYTTTTLEPILSKIPEKIHRSAPPLADAHRRAKYSLHFLICARFQSIFSIKEKSILLGSALNEQAAGLRFGKRAKIPSPHPV